jgi:hypothetical protein
VAALPVDPAVWAPDSGLRTPPLDQQSFSGICLFRVKGGKVQTEQMFSGLHQSRRNAFTRERSQPASAQEAVDPNQMLRSFRNNFGAGVSAGLMRGLLNGRPRLP